MKYFLLYKSIAIGIFILLISSCSSSDSNSDRDAKREQTRNYALSKQEELSKIIGNYFGHLSSNGKEIQKIGLRLMIKEDVITSESEVDPVRLPRLAGYMRLGYVSNSASNSHISFAVKKGEYDDKLGVISLELTNSEYGVLNLELLKSEKGISGKWISQENSLDGEIFLGKLNEGDIRLKSDFISNPLDAEFIGYLTRGDSYSYHLAKVIFQTQKSDNDSLTLSASLILNNGQWADSEFQKFSFSKVNFNALTGAITMFDDSLVLSLSGNIRESELSFEWSSSYTGYSGALSLNSKEIKKVNGSYIAEPAISGAYFGKISYNTNHSKLFPEDIVLNLSMREEHESSYGSTITGKIRFYIGSYGSQEYLEIPFSEVDYNIFTRKLVIRTTEPYQLTISASLQNGIISGDLTYGSLGNIGSFSLSESGRDNSTTDMQGQYQAIFMREDTKLYQLASLQLMTSYRDRMIVSGNLKLIFGTWHSSEYLTYQFEDIEFNPENSMLTISSDDSDIYLEATYQNGILNGSWYSKIAGKLGRVTLQKGGSPEPPTDFSLMPGIGGTYLGRVLDLNENTNLPEKISINIVSSRDMASEDGISLQGSLRLYLGKYESHEYVEHKLIDIRHNFFTGDFNASTEDIGLSVKGTIKNNMLTGNIFHDGFGKIGKIEVARD